MTLLKEREDNEKIRRELRDLSEAKAKIELETKINYPEEWDPMRDIENLKIVQLLKNTKEYRTILNEISKTIPSPNILKIERVQNKWLWKSYVNRKNLLRDKGVEENEKWLYHGTRTTDPEQIYNGEFGFDLRHSNAGGLYGFGIYFAVNASFCKPKYCYRNKNGTLSLFYVKVALGDTIEVQPNPTIRMPPEKPRRKNFAVERYDSVKGGTQMYTVYENFRAYPNYLITFVI